MFATQLLAQEERQGNIYVFETFLLFFLGVLPFFFFLIVVRNWKPSHAWM